MNSHKFKDKISLQVDSFHSGIRIDKFIADKIESLSRSMVKNLIENSFVTSSLKTILECDQKTQQDEIFTINIPLKKDSVIKSNKIDFTVVFEDEDLVVIDKPAGVTVHPGAGTADDTLVHGLIYRFGKNLSDVGGKDRPGIVHRLDKNTSGLMLVAKTNRAHLRLSQMIKDKEIKRSYIAITLGMPKPSSGVIESNITRSSVDRKKMAITDFGGKKSVTNYSTKQIFKNGLASLVECNLETGRTHQIRVHLNSIGAPILGDPDYGTTKSYKLQILGKEVLDELNKLKRQALHSYSLSFTHCYTGEKLNFQSSLPDDINRLVNILK